MNDDQLRQFMYADLASSTDSPPNSPRSPWFGMSGSTDSSSSPTPSQGKLKMEDHFLPAIQRSFFINRTRLDPDVKSIVKGFVKKLYRRRRRKSYYIRRRKRRQ